MPVRIKRIPPSPSPTEAITQPDDADATTRSSTSPRQAASALGHPNGSNAAAPSTEPEVAPTCDTTGMTKERAQATLPDPRLPGGSTAAVCAAISDPSNDSNPPRREPLRRRGAATRRASAPRMVAAPSDRRSFIGGSDARIIMGQDEAALLRLWREKRGEALPPDLSGVLIVQLGLITEDLNRRWYETQSGHRVTDIQNRLRHPVHSWMAATLDGRVDPGGAVFEAKFMLPWGFSEQAAAEKHMAQLQHNMWVANSRIAVLSIITGGGQWLELKIAADPLYQHLLLTAEKKFWRCVGSGETPRLFGVDLPRPRLEAVRIVDMNASNAWGEFAAVYRDTYAAHQRHEGAKAELKTLVPEDAKQAIGHGLRARRSKAGAVSFDLLDTPVTSEVAHASQQ